MYKLVTANKIKVTDSLWDSDEIPETRHFLLTVIMCNSCNGEHMRFVNETILKHHFAKYSIVFYSKTNRLRPPLLLPIRWWRRQQPKNPKPCSESSSNTSSTLSPLTSWSRWLWDAGGKVLPGNGGPLWRSIDSHGPTPAVWPRFSTELSQSMCLFTVKVGVSMQKRSSAPAALAFMYVSNNVAATTGRRRLLFPLVPIQMGCNDLIALELV